MDNCVVGSCGLHKAGLVLALFFLSFPAFSYTPPKPPGEKVCFTTQGPNAEAQMTAATRSPCSPDKFSWRPMGDVNTCFTGDPNNISCYYCMTYLATDVNHCQDTGGSGGDGSGEGGDTGDGGSSGGGSGGQVRPGRVQSPDYFTDAQGNERSNNSLITQIQYSGEATNQNLDRIKNTLYEIHTENIKANTSNERSNTLLSQVAYSLLENNQSLKAAYERQAQEISASLGIKDLLKDIKEHDIQKGQNDNSYLWSISDDVHKSFESLTQIKDNLGNRGIIDRRLAVISGDIAQSFFAMNDMKQLLSNINESIKSLKSGGGDGSGSGSGSGDGDGKGDKNDVYAVACEKFSCTKDSSVECYIARNEWYKRCRAQQAYSFDGELGTLRDSIDSFVNSGDSDVSQINKGRVDVMGKMDKYQNGNGFTTGASASCPAPYVKETPIGTIRVEFDALCDIGFLIRFFVIAFASIHSIMLIVRNV